MGNIGGQRFEIVDKLGEGGMGVVYHARDRTRGGEVALKTLRRLDASSLYRFKREFRAVSDLSHPNIVALHELFAEGDEWFFTMELVQGCNLIEWVRDGRPFKKPSGTDHRQRHISDLVRSDRLYDALTQLAHALVALHGAGMVHRDLKPSNVRVTTDGKVVLMDFGIVAETRESSVSQRTEAALGTPYFMAPEQVAGAPPTAAADWYAFGVILHLAITGRLPFRGRTRDVLIAKQRDTVPPPDLIAQGIPAQLSELCSSLLSRRPSRRATGADVLRALTGDAQAAPTEVTHGEASVFVGRERELEILQRAYARALDDRSVCVFIDGESGIGKTSLVNHFLTALQLPRRGRRLPVVLRGRCHERERMSYKAVDGLMDSLAHALADTPLPVLESLLPENSHLLLRLFPVMQVVPGLHPPAQPVELGPEELRAQAIEVLRAVLSGLARTRPVVAYIDDLQWADQDSLSLLLELGRAPTPAPFLLIAALRAENLDADPELLRSVDAIAERFRGGRIILGTLSEAEQRALMARLVEHREVDQVTGDRLLEEATGVPLLLVELVRYQQHVDRSNRAEPSGVEDMIRRRVAHLPRDAGVLAEVMAIAAEPTPLSVLAKAAELAPAERERASNALRAHHVCRVAGSRPEPVLVPYHDRVRAAIASGLSDERRQQIHRQLALALDETGDGNADALGRHWLGAGDMARAAAYFEQAAELASEVLAFGYAADRYEAAIELTQSTDPDLLARLAHALSLAGRGFEAARVYQRAAQADETRELEFQRLAAHHLLRSGHMEAGLAATEHVMRKLGAPFARSRRRAIASVIFQRMRIAIRGYGYTGRAEADVDPRDLDRLDTLYAAASSLGMIDHLRGAAAQTHHLRTALEVGEERRVCRALAIESVYLGASGGRDERRAQEFGRDAILQAKRLDDPYLLGIAQMTYGGMQLFSGMPRKGVAALLEAGPLLSQSRQSHQWEGVTARYFLALSQIALGQLRAASSTTARALDEAERGNDVYARAIFKCLPATWDMLRRGADRAAMRQVKDALRDWPEDKFYVEHYLQAYSRALVHLYRGEGMLAAQVLDESLPEMRRLLLTRMPWIMGELHTLQGRAGLQAGDERRVERAIRYLRRTKIVFFAGSAALLEGGRAAQRGEITRAQQLTADAITSFREIGARQLRAAATYRLGALLGGEQGERMMDEARTWATSEAVADLDSMLLLLAPGLDATDAAV